MSSTPNLSSKPYLVPAGGSLPVSRRGTLIFCFKSTGSAGDITLRVGNSGTNRFDQGDKYRFNPEDRFDVFYLDNGSGADVTVTVCVGDGDVSISNAVSVTGTVATLENKSANAATIADVALNNASVTLVVPATSTQREAHVSNLLANNQVMRYGDSNTGAARGAELAVGEKLIWTSTAALYLYSPAAGKSAGVTQTKD